jgi:hypothetical protein
MSDPRCLESRSWQVWWLIDAMGDATRDESAAIARRFALIGELDARRAREWEERNLWCTDPYEAVAAEISAAQNISRGAGLRARSITHGSCATSCPRWRRCSRLG